MNHKVLLIAAFLALGVALCVSASADNGRQELRFTISRPVEIPGRVLNPGTYEIEQLSFGEHVAVVLGAKGTFYGAFETIPTFRYRHVGQAKLDLSAGRDYRPARIRDWFYSGDNYGHRLLYTSRKTVQLARSNQGGSKYWQH